MIRSINQGEFLITDDENDVATLTRLLFVFEKWRFDNEHEPQFKRYCIWLKQHIVRQHPCIVTVYLDDADDKDDDYDHIMPAIGIEYTGTDYSYDSKDVLLFYNLFDLKLLERQLSIDDMIKTREACNHTTATGGCFPQHTNYGCAILGIQDEHRATKRVRLEINLSDEPNLSIGDPPVLMQGTITVFELESDQDYVLLRYDSHKHVPTSGDVQTFLRSKYSERHDFRANSDIYSYKDPKGIPSNGATYYRCVPSKCTNTLYDGQKSEKLDEL